MHSNKLAGGRFGTRVVVFGAGPVGLLSAVARAFGAGDVIFVDVFDNKLQRAKDLAPLALSIPPNSQLTKLSNWQTSSKSSWAAIMQMSCSSVRALISALTPVSKLLKLEEPWCKWAWAKTTPTFQLQK